MTTKVHVLLLPGVHALDFAGPVQALYEANGLGGDYALEYVGATKRVQTAQGFWVNVTTIGDGLFTISEPVMTSGTIMLAPGWNIVGLPRAISMGVPAALGAIAYQALWGYDGSSTYAIRAYTGADSMDPGAGYWIRVASTQVWDP